MDHFERELARMMRDTEEHTPFEPAQQDRLTTGIRARRRVRSARKAVGSVVAVAGLSVGLFLLPHTPEGDRPEAPLPMTGRPSPDVSPTPTPPQSSSATPTGSGTTTPDDTASTTTPPTAPASTGGSTSVGTDPSRSATTSPPPRASSTPSGSITPPPPTTPVESSSSSSADATDTG
ncbi:cellulase [Streptomyces sp. NBC_01455]|uniref:cellulase n=1 Tax=Streptomyces sp. NBC_01455 TaxID=2903874 RepID=UPI002E37C847|nr:cellulase [Streptomyces sp. NBC_01455]